MKIAVVGTGYVGLVTGTCFADSGNEVVCVDIDETKIGDLKEGKIPIYEPGLGELVASNSKCGRLRFTTDLVAAIKTAKAIYLAVGTPSADDGSADLSALWAVVAGVAPHIAGDAVVVIKSTVPVGTNAAVRARLHELTGHYHDVASNPEFLKEGAAINDFMCPDRVVVGARKKATADVLRQLYAPFLDDDRPFLVMSPESAELTKYTANALLSTKISFINEIANLCQKVGGDITDVRSGIGHDRRIGFSFLAPGVGYGGSCFPKDVRALAYVASCVGIEPLILTAVDEVNNRQKYVLAKTIENHFGGNLDNKVIAIWGLAFKPETDDMREAPALVLIDRLLQLGARLQVYDPEAMDNVKSIYGHDLTYAARKMDALDGAHALAINTEWSDFHNPDLSEMRRRMLQPVIFDGRNLYEPGKMMDAGFAYYSIGRSAVKPGALKECVEPEPAAIASRAQQVKAA